MQPELLAVLNYLETERGICRESLLHIVAEALIVAAKKSDGPSDDMEVKVDAVTGDISAVAHVTVVPSIDDPATEMDLERAQERYPNCEIGDYIEWEVKVEDFGRVAAQTYRQALITRLNQEEKRIACEEFIDSVGTILSGEIKSYKSGEFTVDFGKVDGLIPRDEAIPGEEFNIGDVVSVLLKEIDTERMKSCLVLSRKDPKFVQRIFEREITEIADGLIEIKGIARDAGFRSKVAVFSTSKEIDPVGSCVGMRGARVRSIIRELNNEKIDIVVWSEDLATYVRNALAPAVLESVSIDEENHTIRIVAREDQYSLAIGKKGQNARLASKLLGWKIDINREEAKAFELSFEDQLNQAVEDLASVDGIDEQTAKKLVNAGFLSVAGLKAANIDDLTAIEDITAEQVAAIKEAVSGM